jgi:IclR family KDG regulon transcriptional repressor
MLDNRSFEDDQPGQFNKATVQILQVLSLYVGRRSSYGVTELSRELNISKNMAYRALSTLVREGFVVKDASGSRYELGFGVLEILDLDADLQFDVRSFCAPFLQRLHKLTGESIFLSVIVGLNHVTIDSVEAHGIRVSHNPRGLLVPLHASPASRVLLSFLSDEEITEYIRAASPLKRFTATTITDPDELWKEVALVRAQGFARGYGDHYAHATYISFPVLDSTGRPHAAITVGGPADRLTEPQVERLLPGMMEIVTDMNSQSALYTSDSRILVE